MSALEGLKRCSFSDIEFPAVRIILHSAGRQHVHEFPHAPGGAPEKLGRGLWYLTVRGNFQDRFKGYQNLYPDALRQLRALYEKQTTATFVHPSVGEFDAFITNWRQEYEPGKMLSGEMADIEFLEDQRSQFLSAPVAGFEIPLDQSQSDLDQQLAAIQQSLLVQPYEMSVFDSLRATVNAVLAIRDTVGLYSELLQTKALELVNLCQQVDSLPSMQNPLAIGILDPLFAIGAAAQALCTQIASQNDLAEWTTPKEMSASDIAAKLYGDSSRQQDIINLNAAKIVDPFAVPANTDILYFPQQTP